MIRADTEGVFTSHLISSSISSLETPGVTSEGSSPPEPRIIS